MKAGLEKQPALAVYDPDGIYRNIITGLADIDSTVIDGGSAGMNSDAARNACREHAGRLQMKLMDAIAAERWPAVGMPGHTQVFDKFAAPETGGASGQQSN